MTPYRDALMSPFDFPANDLPKPKAGAPVLTTADVNEPVPAARVTLRSGPRGGEMEDISERLENLANQLNAFNVTRRSSGLSVRTVSGHLPYFGKPLASDAEAGPSEPPVSTEHNPPPARDAEGRVWPRLLPARQSDVRALEDRIAEQSAELAERGIQIADLCNIREEQTVALISACDEIDILKKFVAELERVAARREAESLAANQRLALLDLENIALKAQLDNVQHQSAEQSQRLLDAETVVKNKTAEIAAAEETIGRLNADLAAARAEKVQAEAAIEEKLYLRHCEGLEQQRVLYENKISASLAGLADRDQKIKDLESAHAELAARFASLSTAAAALENVQQQLQEKDKVKAQQIELLEVLLKFERKTSEARITALISELERERSEHYLNEQVSAEMRRHIVLLLPKLVARRIESHGADRNSLISCNNAA